MSVSNPIAFHDALRIAGKSPKHLLLGNGFCIACIKKFSDRLSLRRYAAMQSAPDQLVKLLAHFKGADFEAVMGTLERMTVILKDYGQHGAALSVELGRDVRRIPDLLIGALLYKHPTDPNEIDDERFECCVAFLSHFHEIFTVNYDLLLYWAAQRLPKQRKSDGFRGSPLVWKSSNDQKITYLHGGLHLFKDGTRVRKLKSDGGSKNLVPQIKHRMKTMGLPLVVCEGSWKAKLLAIKGNQYLEHAFDRFGRIRGSLFVFGWSMKPRKDGHLVDAIASNNNLKRLFVGIRRQLSQDERRQMAGMVKRMRASRKELLVEFFDRESAQVWQPALDTG